MRLFEGTPFDIPPTCERCRKLESECACPALPDPLPARIPPGKQTARVQSEKRKKGKFVTVIRGLDAADLPELLVRLKNDCGAGGTIKDEAIEIQGRHEPRINRMLKDLGFRVK